MKRILIFSAISASILFCSAAWACSPSVLSAMWPAPDQKGVPLNARVKFLCMEGVYPTMTASLTDSKGRPVPFTVGEVDKPKSGFGQKYYELIPARNLKPMSSYTAMLAYPGHDRTLSFETGARVDKEPPVIDAARITAEIKWVGDRESALLYRPGMCGQGEYDVKEAKKARLKIEKGDYLPEHYNVVVTVDGVVDDTGYSVFRLFEVMDDGTRKDMGEFGVPVVNIGRIDAKDAGKSRRYELEARDALGNVQPERIGFQINFDRNNSNLAR